MKVVMLVNEQLPLGLIANTTAVLGISLGRLFPDIVGPDNQDADGTLHLGITAKAVPILRCDAERLKDLRIQLTASPEPDLTVIDFSETAQRCLDYGQYTHRLSTLQQSDLSYLGLCLYGPAKKINRLTGNMGLLR